jgi:transcriptional regulator with XRE-family HTH domain
MKFDADKLTKEQLSQKIGEKIRHVRLELNITQVELARRCEKDKQHLELIENGKVSPNIYTIYLISVALNLELGDLLNLKS